MDFRHIFVVQIKDVELVFERGSPGNQFDCHPFALALGQNHCSKGAFAWIHTILFDIKFGSRFCLRFLPRVLTTWWRSTPELASSCLVGLFNDSACLGEVPMLGNRIGLEFFGVDKSCCFGLRFSLLASANTSSSKTSSQLIEIRGILIGALTAFGDRIVKDGLEIQITEWLFWSDRGFLGILLWSFDRWPIADSEDWAWSRLAAYARHDLESTFTCFHLELDGHGQFDIFDFTVFFVLKENKTEKRHDF